MIHTPERQPDETQEQYRERRKASAKDAQAMTCATFWKQHGLPSSREQLRDEQRKNGKGPRAYYGAGLLQPQRKRNQQRMEKIHAQRDENGVYTLIGGASPRRVDSPKGPRRIWLAGISAQRGY